MYLIIERKLVEALHLSNTKSVNENLKALLKKGHEDTAIIILREALIGGYLATCSKAAAVISGVILEAKPQRIMLARLGEQINDPANISLGNEWVDIVLATDTGLSIDQWVEAWNRNEDVQVVKRLFRQAPYSSAIDGRCKPIDPRQLDDHPKNTDGRIIPELVFD